MSAFRYEAIDPTGRTLKGVLEADSARAGRSHLRTQGLTPLIVELAAQRPHGERHQRHPAARQRGQGGADDRQRHAPDHHGP